MKRFDLIASVKGLIKDKAYEAGNEASYFIPGMSQEFNPRSDDSWQAMFLKYNPTLYNEDYDGIDKLCEASQDLIGRLTEQFKEYVQGDYKVNEVGNGITVVTSNRAGIAIALTFADSDLGMYITYMETLA
jgi:hypothetical protein